MLNSILYKQRITKLPKIMRCYQKPNGIMN
jgi:hypothetical protein